MGRYLNPGNGIFKEAVTSEVYVDKTGLIAYISRLMHTSQKYLCVSRPRRFGKTTAAAMLAAYYGKGCSSRELFENLDISKDASFLEHLNKYDVISLNMQEFLDRSDSVEDLLERVVRVVLRELKDGYPQVSYYDGADLIQSLHDIYAETANSFVIIIDEWDCVLREYGGGQNERYASFLRGLLKDQEYVRLAYMTGILPIKKYGTHSALNMFTEYSMTNPRQLTKYIGFTAEETASLCARYAVDADEVREWYDGYKFYGDISIYNPKSVVEAVTSGICDTYWNQTETFEALRAYIDMNFDGLRDDVLTLLAGNRVRINTGSFSNDMDSFRTKDDVLTLLVHLGYLGYDFAESSVFIPNEEIRREFISAVSVSEWGEVSEALKRSSTLLEAIWDGNCELVASELEHSHFETSHIRYNDENALSYTISLALYTARNYYSVTREFPAGKGFADMVYVPRSRFRDKPALVVELKWDKSADGAIAQIKEKKYCKPLEGFDGKVLLVGVNYDKGSKKHECRIEEMEL